MDGLLMSSLTFSEGCLSITPNGYKYIVVLMQYICCYKYVKQKLYKLKEINYENIIK